MATAAERGAGEPAVVLEGVVKRYRQRQRSESLRETLRHFFRPRSREVVALDGVDLTVARGEIVAYAGPNGAGKSTTIKLLASLLAPEGGRVRSLGMDPARERVAYVGRIGVVFGQRTELWWDHPVAASYEWKRVVWDVPDDVYARMLGTVRETLGLDDFFHTAARELSLGQRMRADLGMALLHEPELVLLDEPTLGLDVLARRRVLDFLKQWNRDSGVTVIVTSHDMAELEQLAGRIVLLDRGRIAFDGDFSELRRAVSRRRVLRLETDGETAPELAGATHRGSEGRSHEYVYDASERALVDLLAEAGRQAAVVDVESHRPAIDDVVADLYEGWSGGGAGGAHRVGRPAE